MGETRQTTIRFGDVLYKRLEEASERTGLPINSLVIIACMEWLKQNEPDLAYKREFGVQQINQQSEGEPHIL